MSKISRLASLLHSSTTFKERFEQIFGNFRSIPVCNATRWNSVLRQVHSVLALTNQQLTDLCRTLSHSELIFSAKEWLMLNELSEVLSPFLEATNLTQGEYILTITSVVPTVLALNTHLNQCKSTIKNLKPMIDALKSALWDRFNGIFANCFLPSDRCFDDNAQQKPFGEPIYFMACTLDPNFTYKWLIDVDATPRTKDALRARIKGKVVLF